MADLSLYVLAVFLLKGVNSDIFFKDIGPGENHIDVCSAECVNRLNLESNNVAGSGSSSSCSRGCRFFAVAQMINSGKMFDRDSILDTCKSACHDGYGERGNDLSGCSTGCELFAPQIPLMTEFTWSLIVENANSVQVLQGDLGEVDDVLAVDPGLVRTQLSKLHRLPEMRVRTLPISNAKEEVHGRWWRGCGSGSPGEGGVPHCLAASLLLLLILVALWFGLSLEETRSTDPNGGQPGDSQAPLLEQEKSGNIVQSMPPPPYSSVVADEFLNVKDGEEAAALPKKMTLV